MTDNNYLILTNPFSKTSTAYHEAGHLLVAEIMQPGAVMEATMIMSTKNGVCWHGYVRHFLLDKCCSFLDYPGISDEIADALISIAGREAQILSNREIFDEGCGSDYKKFALDMHEFYEKNPKIRMMLAEPSRFIPNINRRQVLKKAHNVQAEKDRDFLAFYTSKLLVDNMPYLKLVAEKLYEKKRLKREDIDELLKGAEYNIDALRSFQHDVEYYCKYPERFETGYRPKYTAKSDDEAVYLPCLSENTSAA